MRLLRRLNGLYASYRRIMWLTGIVGTFAPTLLGYGMYALQTIKTKRGMAEDDPEHASILNVDTPLDWLTQASGWLPIIVKTLTLIGIAVLVIATVSFIAKRTTLTGRDKELEDGEELENINEEYDAED
ncbi:hypothetical protein LF916_08875 [Bifidobacterium pseudolongum]|uniref:hypothetical protein n=1 Tax=Bifidobacterium pseudolongum TaxID=1694 RepID=UPI001F0EF7BB|nr:hypothetical protein [Bifidobacterium pseudolongum]MCH4860975.1 hypothetical protein [Bifidobacterium pseudolongum]MCH4862748.1 hypothetical protein [Bifidobacterium pseudolongum]